VYKSYNITIDIITEGDKMSYSLEPDYYQQYLFPLCLEDLVPRDHPARFIRAFVDSIELEKLGFRSSPGINGRPHYSNSMKLKIWLYGYFRKIYSTRQLEDACRNDVGLLWLAGLHHPDHNTLWSFFDSNRRAMRKLFKSVTRTALKAGLIGFTLHALDGTKIQAKVSTRTGWKYEDLAKMLKEVDSSVDEIVKKIRTTNKKDVDNFKLPEELQDQQTLKKKIERILGEMNEINREHLHKDDKDARMMKKGNTSEFCYNSQAVVDADSNLIVAEDVTNAEKDNNMLVPMIENGEENLGALAEETLADGGYYAPEQLTEADAKGIGVLVNLDGQILPREDNKFHKSNFIYDKEKDVFICPMGKELIFERIKHGPKRRRDIRVYRCHHKKVCIESNICSRDKRGKSIEKEPYYEFLQRQIQKQKDPGNKEILARRKQIVEPVFGTIKEVLKFRRFTVKGLDRVKTQWSLICTTFNLRKLFKVWTKGNLIIA
jgi:transposase